MFVFVAAGGRALSASTGARDFMDKNPVLALEAGLAALRWLGEGYGYEVSGADVVGGLLAHDKRRGVR